MQRNHVRTLLTLALAASAFVAVAAPPSYVPLERRLSAEQLHATGLDQLSASQLSALNAILAAETPAAPARGSSVAVRETARAPIEGRLVGRFSGWVRGTVFTLDSGSRWQVTEGSFDTRSVEAPRVTVKPGLFSGWYMYVEGQPVVASVRRVR